MSRDIAACLAVVVALGGSANAMAGQKSFGITPMAQGIFTVDHSAAIPGGGSLTEARLVQRMQRWHREFGRTEVHQAPGMARRARCHGNVRPLDV